VLVEVRVDRNIQVAPQRGGERTERLARRGAIRALAALAVSCLGALAGCTMAVKLGYNNADTLVVYTFDSYLDLDDNQSRFLRQRTQALVAWHRASQLDEYARTLTRIDAQVGNGSVGAADVLGFIGMLDDRMVTIGDQAAPDLAQLAATLRPAQIDRLEQKLAQQADKSRRKADRLARPDVLDERVRTYASQAEPWFGPLSAAQRELVRASMAARPEAPRGWSDEVEQRGKDLARLAHRIAEGHPEPAVATQWVRDYLAHLAVPDDPKRRAFLEANRRANAELIAQLMATSTPRQRAAVQAQLARYAGDFTALRAAPG
jgi:hypothetical protein